MDRKELIEKEYETILDRIKDGNLWGEAIDINDPKQVAVAFYYMGKIENYHLSVGLIL